MSTADLEKLVLSRARNGLRPSAARRDALVSRLKATLAASAPHGLTAEANGPKVTESLELGQTSHAAGHTASSTALRFSKSVVTAGIVSGALAGFGAGYWLSPDGAPDTQRHAASDSNRAREAAPPMPLEPKSASGTSSKSEASSPATRARPSAPAPAHASKTRHVNEPHSGATADSKPTFYEELSYVRRAQSALQRGDGTLALGLMQSLDEIQPGGALLAERHVTRILALCQLDRREEAIAWAKRVLSSDGTTKMYRHRLSVSCAREALSEAEE